MAWTELTRAQHNRKTARYPSDLTAEEWAVVCPLLPKDFPPVSTVRYYFYRWRDDGLLSEINRALVAQARHAVGRGMQPTAGVIDSQSVKTSENTSISGFDAGKRIKGRGCARHRFEGPPSAPDHHRQLASNLIACQVHSAGIQDRDGAPGVFAKLRREAPRLRHMFVDGGYAGPKLREALVPLGRWTLQIVKRSDAAKGFVVLPRRWVVERTFAWLGRCRRLAKDWEKTIESAEAWVHITHIRRITRLLART